MTYSIITRLAVSRWAISLAVSPVLLLLFASFCWSQSATVSEPVAQQAVAEPEVSGQAQAETKTLSSLDQISYDIEYLSSDEMGGRQPGKPGIKLAEDYIVAEYKKAGLKPLADGTYLQPFTVGGKRVINKESRQLALSGPNGTEIELIADENYSQLMVREDFDLSADLVFVGYGISASRHNYDEYADIDVEGKIVVLIRREPQVNDPNSVFDGTETSRYGAGRKKIITARRAGAAGILMVNDGATATDEEHDELIDSSRFGTSRLPFAQIKRTTLDKMLSISPLNSPLGEPLDSVASIEKLINSNLEPISQPIEGWQATMKTEFDVNETITSNIIGIIEGEGPHADEVIVIGGHYDHLGLGEYGSRAGGRREIHNGADDNATGTAAVIELARRINRRDKKPARTLVFACFTAEEMGLLGAYHYVDNPILPLEKTIAMVNFDMIGWLRNDELTIFGWNSSPQLGALVDAANENIGLNLLKPDSGFGGSDHLPFNARQIPNMFIHSGLNEVYHTPEDDFAAINCEGALKVIDYSEVLIDGLASTETELKFGKPKRLRLGVRLLEEDDVVTIVGVTSDSIAEQVGIQVDDVITEFGDQTVTARRKVAMIIRRETGNTVTMKIKRGDEELEFDIELVQPEEE